MRNRAIFIGLPPCSVRTALRRHSVQLFRNSVLADARITPGSMFEFPREHRTVHQRLAGNRLHRGPRQARAAVACKLESMLFARQRSTSAVLSRNSKPLLLTADVGVDATNLLLDDCRGRAKRDSADR